MYSSNEQRDADIEAGALRSAGELRDWARASAAALDEDFGSLDEEQWARQVRTAQGRTVPATEVPWMRSREVMVHAVDLGGGVSFADLPQDFLRALVDDIVGKRSASGDGPALTLTAKGVDRTWSVAGHHRPTAVTGLLGDLTAYLAGRSPHAVVDADGNPAPPLPRWL